MVVVPDAEGVKLTEQLDARLTPGTRVQVVDEKVPAAPVLENVTVPDGDVVCPVTVAVQLDAWLITTVDGVQDTDVVVDCTPEATVSLNVPELDV